MAEAKTISNLPPEAHTRYARDEIITRTSEFNSESISWSALAASISSTSPSEKIAEIEKMLDFSSTTSKWAEFNPPDGFEDFVRFIFSPGGLTRNIRSSEELTSIREKIKNIKPESPEAKNDVEKLSDLANKLGEIADLLAKITAKCNEYQKG